MSKSTKIEMSFVQKICVANLESDLVTYFEDWLENSLIVTDRQHKMVAKPLKMSWLDNYTRK